MHLNKSYSLISLFTKSNVFFLNGSKSVNNGLDLSVMCIKLILSIFVKVYRFIINFRLIYF